VKLKRVSQFLTGQDLPTRKKRYAIGRERRIRECMIDQVFSSITLFIALWSAVLEGGVGHDRQRTWNEMARPNYGLDQHSRPFEHGSTQVGNNNDNLPYNHVMLLH
jgi:hypothetical protein